MKSSKSSKQIKRTRFKSQKKATGRNKLIIDNMKRTEDIQKCPSCKMLHNSNNIKTICFTCPSCNTMLLWVETYVLFNDDITLNKEQK